MKALVVATLVSALVCPSGLAVAATKKEASPAKQKGTTSAATIQAPPAKPLRIFEFKGSNTEEVSSYAQQNPTICKAEGDKVDCTDFDATLAGQKMRWVSEDFYLGKLYYVYGSFNQFAFGELLSAFTTKYGAPDSQETRKWQSKGGSTFDNQVIIWKFKGGSLELASMGLKVGEGQFEFNSAPNSPPSKPAKVDF